MPRQGNARIRRCARRYAENAGLPDPHPPEFTKSSERRGILIADLFEAMSHTPEDPVVAFSYSRFIQETLAQYEFVVKELDLRVEAWNGAQEPYRDSQHMMDDIRHNGHLYFLSTRSRWGEGDVGRIDSPMLAPTGIYLDGVELLANDMFRVVHDVFAHAKEGHQFGAVGEDNAWLEHLAMFSPAARPALTAETRGQTCWTFFGPHLRSSAGRLFQKNDPRWTPVPKRPFASQKVGLLPAEVSGVRMRYDRDTQRVRTEQLPRWHPDSCLALDYAARTPTPDIPRDLADAYLHTTYRAVTSGGTIDIRVGRRCAALDDMLAQQETQAWGFLTAWNPGSQELCPQDNQERNRRLEDRLRQLGTVTLPGVGIGDDTSWEPEASVLALGVRPETAVLLGHEFGQNCVVVGRLGEAPELVWCHQHRDVPADRPAASSPS